VTVTTEDAAERLGVSRRQVQRLIASGELAAQRTAGDAWLVDALALNALARARPSRGRPWTAETAWAALWWLSGLDVDWLGGRTEARLRDRLRSLSANDLVLAARRRATAHHFRASASFLAPLRAEVVLTGASATSPAVFDLTSDESRVDAYCAAGSAGDLAARFHLAPAARGNVTLRETLLTPVVRDRHAMPTAVVALDLAESVEPRERAAGRRVLEGLLR
jgi:excisionase family DNA binding protein